MNEPAALVPLWIVLVIAAPFVGSFLGVLVARLPEGRNVLFGRSICDRCSRPLAPLEMIPVFGWLTHRGRCRTCGSRIDPLYPSIEIATALVVFWAASQVEGDILIATCLLGWTLLVLSVIDWRHRFLPDALTFPLLATGLLTTVLINPVGIGGHLLGAALGFVVFWAVAKAYRHYRRRDGLGLGDAKLLAGIGAWVSWTGLPTVILAGAFFGLLFAVARMISGKTISGTDPIPFGPFLAAGGWLVWLYGPILPA